MPLTDADNNTMRQLGGSFGSALVTTCLAPAFAQHWQALVTHLSAYDPAVAERLARLAQLVAARLGQPLLEGAVNQQAGIQSYNDAFRLVGFCFLAAMPLLLLVVKRKPGAGPVKVSLSDYQAPAHTLLV